MKDRSPVPWEWWELRPMIEAGAPSTGGVVAVLCMVCASHRGWYVRTTDDPAQRFRDAKRRAAPGTKETQRRPGQYSGWGPTPSFAAAKLGSLILREDCYNVVTPAPTVGNDSVVPDSKREKGVHARYALLAMLFWVVAALAVASTLAVVWGLYLLVRRWL